MRNTDSTKKYTGDEHMSSRWVSNSCLLLDTWRATRIVKFSNNHVGDNEKNILYIRVNYS